MLASSMGLCLSGNREIIMMMMMMIVVVEWAFKPVAHELLPLINSIA